MIKFNLFNREGVLVGFETHERSENGFDIFHTDISGKRTNVIFNFIPHHNKTLVCC